ncbi:MAG: DUF1778 domain-containing protein [Betaproteobacteria bacterium]|nr:DUF1778 domain-containing protein [Betaproteobacteria bacterium]
MATTTATREVLINLRARHKQRDLIDRAAEAQGKNRSEFMLQAACEKAQEVLLDRTFFALDKKSYEHFLRLLNAPVKPNAGLKKLLASSAPWEH